jgi:hypothetical protein
MKRDTDLDSLRKGARFKKALAQARARQDANADEEDED